MKKLDLSFLKHKKTFKKENSEENIKLFWVIILGVACLCILLSFGFGYYLFDKLNKDFTSTEENLVGKAEKVKKERMDKVFVYFGERAEKSVNILKSSSPIVDPSR